MSMREAATAGTVRSLLGDALLVSLSNGVLKASSAVMFILVVRALGKTAAGQFSITTSYVAISLGLALLGLDEILIRESRRQENAAHLFMNFLMARVGLTTLSAITLFFFLAVAQLYEPHLNFLILVFACGQVGDGILLLCQALFVAQDRTKYVLLTSVSISTVRIGAGLTIIAWGGELAHLFLLYVLTSYGGAALAFWVAKVRVLGMTFRELVGQVDLRYAIQRIRGSVSFFWINLFVLLEFQMDVVLLSILKTAPDVALYSSALTIFTAVWIAPQAYRTAIYMRLAEAYRAAVARFWLFLRGAVLLSLLLGSAAALGLAAASRVLFHVLYPAGYDAGVLVLQVLAIQLLLAFINAPGTRALLTLRKEGVAAILTALVMFINVGANLLLIPRYGPLGAAWAKVVSGTSFCALIYVVLFLARPGSGAGFEAENVAKTAQEQP